MAELKGNLYADNDAWVEINFVGRKGSVEFQIDTGFNGHLLIPTSLADDFKLVIEESTPINLIGLNQDSLPASSVSIKWFDQEIEIPVIISEGEDYLLGTDLLENKELYINYKTGEVVINQT